MAKLNYADAGVDREAADRLVGKIAGLAKSTLNKKVKSSVGGYASLFELDNKRWLAASTDGVGTKLKLAFELGRHDTIGIDLVAMSVNDLLCVGAEPLFFLDYFATGKLDAGVAEKVLEGIVAGCLQATCALVGGETAEMPSMYAPGEYDLAGFAVGFVKPKHVLPSSGTKGARNGVKPGDVLLGIGSSGFHSNGYSLLRKLLELDPSTPAEKKKIAAELLTPTRIYAKSLMPLIEKDAFKGLAHITGSGFLNVPRISEKVSYEITLPPASELPSIFGWMRTQSGLPLEELAQTFNLGIGMVCAVSSSQARDVSRRLKKAGEKVWEIGRVVKSKSGQGSQVLLTEGTETVMLNYS